MSYETNIKRYYLTAPTACKICTLNATGELLISLVPEEINLSRFMGGIYAHFHAFEGKDIRTKYKQLWFSK